MKLNVFGEPKQLTEFFEDLHTGGFTYSGMILHYGRNCVKLFTQGDLKIVVKKYKTPTAVNRFVYTYLRKSKAERGYKNALRLAELGINTPKPLGYVEVKENGLLKTAYLATEYTDYLPVNELLGKLTQQGKELFDGFVAFTVELHRKGIRHDDYNLSNVLYKQMPDGSYDFMLIDINRMKFCRKMSKRCCLSNIKRMCANSDIMYYMCRTYAGIRGWDVYRCVASLAIKRSFFERRRNRKKQIKIWAKSFAKA